MIIKSSFGDGGPDDEQATLVLHREPLEEDAVDHAEHGGCGADSERQRPDRDQCKGRRLAEEAQTMTKIGEESLQNIPPLSAVAKVSEAAFADGGVASWIFARAR